MARLTKSGTEWPVVSVFSGAMGLDLGLEKVGITPDLAIEFDPYCCLTIRQNRPNVDTWQEDIRNITGKDIRERLRNPKDVFLMVGGPPCQSFCPGGKRAALSDPRGNLIYQYLKLIQEVRPMFFVLENVGNLVTAALRHRPISERPGKHWNLSVYDRKKADHRDDNLAMEPDELSGSAIHQILNDVKSMGYDISLSVVDSAEYGAPQRRLRFLMFGARDRSAPKLITPTHGQAGPIRLQTVRDAISDLKHQPGPHSAYTPEVAKYFALIPPGGNWRSLPPQLQREALGHASFKAGGGKTGFFRRLSWDAPAPTITGKANRKGSALCHPESIRPLSVRECARIQGFPDDWQLSGAMNRQYMQVGNAVPVHLGVAIGKTVLQSSTRSTTESRSSDRLEVQLAFAVKRLRSAARNKRGINNQQAVLCGFEQ